jgi:hypothetical protein
MDYHCPVCGHDLGKRRLTQAVVTRMEVDCPQCKSIIRLNVHEVEMVVVVLNFAAIVGLAALAYWLESQKLMLAAFAAAAVGALVVPLLERTYLRSWPRYVSGADSPRP